MFSNTFFSNQAIRKNVALFGTLFNNLRIERTDQANNVQLQIVPIAYGPREKYIARNTQDPKIEREIAAQLPRMAFELMGIEPDADRRLNPVNNTVVFNEGIGSSRLVPSPWNFYFNLYITARFVEDASKIVEQILPYFQPSFSVKAFLTDDQDCSSTVIFTLKNVDMKDNYEGNFQERRILVWTLTFGIKTWIFGPTQQAKTIKWVDTNSQISSANNARVSTYEIQANTYPTANGLTLDQIGPTDNYILVTDISEFFK